MAKDNNKGLGYGLQTETFEFIVSTPAGRFFWFLTGHPRKIIVISLLLIAGIGSFLPRLYKDTSAESFIADDNPAVVYRKQVEKVFGLSDPVIVAVTRSGPKGIFTPEGLNFVADLTESVRRLEGVDPERVTSLSTENNIIGDELGLEVSPFYETPVTDQRVADEVRDSVFRFPLFMGSLVARDTSATLIIAELLDPGRGNEVFHQILDMTRETPDPLIEVHVAGEGAVAEYLGEYVDEDARRLYPFAALVIMIVLFIAYRTPRGIFLPLGIVLGACVIALGAMAGRGVPMYLISQALPVILIAIGVADGIHITGAYYEELTLRPHSQRRQPVVRAMTELWGAVFFTSITDVAGFLALALISDMPPMRSFGIYAAVGVVAALVFSLVLIPTILVLLPLKPSPAFHARLVSGQPENLDRFGALMNGIGRIVLSHPKLIVAISAAAAVAGVLGALQLEVNYSRINYFHEDEPIYQADQLINERFDGSNFIDVVIDAQEADGLLNAGHMRKIEALQQYVATLPHVGGSTSVADYVKQMNRALMEDKESEYVLPEDDNLIAQFFLLFSATGDPDDLTKVVDYDYRLANVRIGLKSGEYRDIKQVILPLNAYLDSEFEDSGLTASVAGRANVTYHWIDTLAISHFEGMLASMFAVWLCAAISFRSFGAAFFAITPVSLAILSIYAFMGALGIPLGVGTSMFAAIGIGLSVDFAIHTLHRAKELVPYYESDLREALAELFPTTGRALLFNFSCVCLGFSVMITSHIRALSDFGLLVAIATVISFVASITTLPALLVVFKPKFFGKKESEQVPSSDYKVTTGDW